MELYKELGIQDGMSEPEIATLLAQHRQQCISLLNHPDLRMQQNAQNMLRAIDRLISADSKLTAKADNPALVMRTLAAGLETGNPQYARYEETVLAIANRELSAAYLKAPMNYLMSVGAEEEYRQWEAFLAKRGARVFLEDGRIARISRSDATSRRRTTSARTAGGRTSGSSGTRRRTGSRRRSGSLNLTKNLNLDFSFLKKIPYVSQIPPKILGAILGGLLLLIIVILLVGRINKSSAERKEQEAAQAQQEEQVVEKTEEELAQEAALAALQGISSYTVLQEGSFNEADYSIILPVKCEASSMLVGQSGKVYGTEFLFDRTVETSWQEGEADEGLGTTIYTEFPENTKIKAIGIWPGNQVNEEKFRANNRPTSLNFSAASAELTANTDVQLQDNLGEQLILFDTAVPMDNLIMTIKGVASGDTYNDTVISEMTFYTEKP